MQSATKTNFKVKGTIHKNKRPKIPDNIKLKLWVFSGGRCEFPGCNKPVWRDGLTLKDDNFAHMAHIVAASSAGPRGDKSLSPQLTTDFSNLMLVCLNHSKLVDGKHKSEYSVDFLRDYKERHEARIKMQTAVSPDMSTTVVRFVAKIRERKMEISTAQAYEAIFPRFPLDEKGIVIDFNNRNGSGGKSHWKSLARDIATQVKQALTPGNDHLRIDHLSVFAVAPIPLLMYLGNRIGGATPVDIYQKHRDADDWIWKKEPKRDTFKYIVKKNGLKNSSTKVVVILSLSGLVQVDEVTKVLPNAPRYEITIPKPDRDYLQHRSQLTKFAYIYHRILTEIRKRHGSKCEIYLFPAVPVSVAVACGKELLPKVDPHIHVYDVDNERGGFIPTLTIN